MTTTGDDEAPASVLAALVAASEAEVTALIDAGSGPDSEPPARASSRGLRATRSEPSGNRAAFVAMLRRASGSQPREREQHP